MGDQMNPNLNLKEFFPPHTYDEWRAAAEKLLKGAPFDKRLIKKTYEGIDILPMYFKTDRDNAAHKAEFPGDTPFVRSTAALGHVAKPWLISQETPYPDPEEFNAAAKNDLSKGQNAVNMPLDRAGRKGLSPLDAESADVGARGVSLAVLEDVEKALKDVDLNNVTLMVQPGASALPAFSLILGCMEKHGMKAGAVKAFFAADPISALACEGALPASLETLYDEMAALTKWAAQNAPGIKTIGASSSPWHNAGANAVQELAYTLSSAVASVDAMMKRGLAFDDIASKLVFTFSVGSDFFMEIAKLRSARLLWENIAEAYGAGKDAKKMVIHARTSEWNKTKTDPYVNMLRVTTETFSAIAGDADSIHVGPFDETIGLPSDFSRRIARNVQIILKDEAHFGKVVDPSGGAYYVESLTDQLTKKAWALFQETEAEGGIFTVLSAGAPQKKIADIAAKRALNLATRKDVFVGTNKYPNLTEAPIKPKVIDHDIFKKERMAYLEKLAAAANASAKDAALSEITAGADAVTVTAAAKAAVLGANISEIAKAVRKGAAIGETLTPLNIHRGAESFENLRFATKAFAEKTGETPKIFLANMGPIPQHKPRADFSMGFFAVAGFDVLENKGFATIDAAADAALNSGARVAVICSTDDTYPDIVPELTKKIKAADPKYMVILAGYPKDMVEGFKQAGVDDFIHLTSNSLEQLTNIQKFMGVI